MNRSILIVMCDFLVSAMLSMLIGMSPHGQSGHMGKGALLDRGSTAIILDELRRRGAELENMREQLREAQAREGFSEAREAQLKALAEQLAETLAKSELLEDKLKLHPENAGALTPQALQQKLEEEIRKHDERFHTVWMPHSLMDHRIVSPAEARRTVNEYMINVMHEEPVDPSLLDFDDSMGW